jgi:hypothetical protein
MKTSTQFHIELDGLNLKEDQVKAIAADLDRVISTHLAKLDWGGDPVTVARPIALNPEWFGIWVRNHKLGAFPTANSPSDVSKALAGLPQKGF